MMDVVERTVERHVNPMREAARRLVMEHRMYIPPLMNFPGLVKKNEDNLEAMLKKKGKTTIGLDHFEGPADG